MDKYPRVLYCFVDIAGKPFRPSNGTEGEVFEKYFCHKCSKEDEELEIWCDIHNRALFHDRKESQYPKEWIFDSEGWPICTAFERMEK